MRDLNDAPIPTETQKFSQKKGKVVGGGPVGNNMLDETCMFIQKEESTGVDERFDENNFNNITQRIDEDENEDSADDYSEDETRMMQEEDLENQ